MKGILEGIRIVDWTLWQVGPAGTSFLADMGADVIHVEEKGVGDSLRGMTTFFGRSMIVNGRHVHFAEQNRNKKSIAVDLGTPGGREIIYRLVKKSQVFATNFRPKARLKLGLDYESLKKVNKDIIYAGATCFGEEGPEKDAPGLEVAGYARSGVMCASGEAGMPPIYPTAGMGDRSASIFLAYGILAALLAKERQGISQEVNVSILAGMMALQAWSITSVLAHNLDYPRPKRDESKNPVSNYYLCKDGRWIALGLFQSQRYWPAFCKVIEKPELENDQRFNTAERRADNCKQLIAILDEVFAKKTFEEWEPALRFADIIFSKLNTLLDLVSDPQVIANNYVVEWTHPTAGKVKALGPPVKFSKTPTATSFPAPEELGQDTEQVLLDVCSYTWDDIKRFQDGGAI